MRKPKILLVDIETAPLEVFAWQIFDINVGLNQIKKDWSVLAWAAKWIDEPEVFYMDVSQQKNKRSDKKILKPLWKLLDEADIVVSQNGKRFDIPKLNARFIHHGLKPYAPIQHIDTRQLAKRRFGFTSNSLEYLCAFLGTDYKKLKHKNFPGQDLWTECLKGNQAAWKEMRTYNKHDVLALQGVYEKLRSWGTGVNFTVYLDRGLLCSCGSTRLQKRGEAVTSGGRYARYQCQDCGSWSRGKKNLIGKKQRKKIKPEIK